MKSRDVSVIEMLQLLAMEVSATGSSAEILEGCAVSLPPSCRVLISTGP